MTNRITKRVVQRLQPRKKVLPECTDNERKIISHVPPGIRFIRPVGRVIAIPIMSQRCPITTDNNLSYIWDIQGIRNICYSWAGFQRTLCRPRRFSLHNHKPSPYFRSASSNLPGFHFASRIPFYGTKDMFVHVLPLRYLR